jgi:LmbE family N-acetylglucosaminyl deacetylase
VASDLTIERFMVVVAHPDDAEFSCAGTVARWVQEGKQAVYVLCTSGNKGSGDPEMTGERLAGIREAEQLEAAAVLGVGETVFLRLPDNELFTHDPWRPYSFHSDHRTVGLTVVDSVYPTARDRLNYPDHEREGLQPWKVGAIYLYGAAEPDAWVDISDTIHLKLEALRKHVCQVGTATDLDERLRDRAREVGQSANLPFAEAFKVLRLSR